MKNWRKIGWTILVLLMIFIFSFYPFTYKIKNGEWKFSKGYHIGDWISFKETNYKVNNLGIYKKDSLMAKILVVGFNRMLIKDVTTGELGYYVNKVN